MHQHHEVRIAACPDYVWAVLTDVARWPQWASALREVVPYDGGPLVVGGRVRVRARNLPVRDWCVREVRAHRGFTWEQVGVGSAATLVVGIRPAPPGGTTLELTARRSGWVASVVDRMTGATATAHLEELADGLRRRCEAGQCAPVSPPAQSARDVV
ncbi:SRPBCC family protein [Actinomycetospora endophytica]|uniref:SRPBCC family protein n=1 Tax=Actinomycetospora endophytica TaxID=2291215 RepID=A0ABS8P297_9PSEU|nr:SRPBCC family protein [Actinomycetospora endophytica]MCD2192348.1 SRPBCC family protein [Actinomycetospora endophytica]